jgi:GMP synthase-like glutamine amidotransferase
VSDRTALVVASAIDADSGFVGDRLQQSGFTLRTVFRDDAGVPVSVAAAGHPDLVVLLGSEWSVHAPVEPGSLEAECELVRSARLSGTPVLGLCYGAQVLAHAFGGRVSAAARPEIGLVEVETSDPDLVPAGPWAAFHVDVLEPPPDATVVARNSCGVQAFVLPGALGVQFHPEVRPGVLDGWSRRFPDLVLDAGLQPAVLVAQASDREEDSRRAAYTLVDAFLARLVPPLSSPA